MQRLSSPAAITALDDGAVRRGRCLNVTVSERVANQWPGLARQFSKADLDFVADQWVKRQKPQDVRQQVAVLRRLLELVESRVKD